MKNDIKNVSLARMLRERMGLTQPEVAKACGLTAMDICRVEQGKLNMFSYKLVRLAEFYDVSVDDLVNNRVERIACDDVISGTKFHMKRRRLTQSKLSELAGIPQVTLTKIIREVRPRTMLMDSYVCLAKALDVTVDELLTPHRRSELGDGDRAFRDSRASNYNNLIALYRRQQSLTFRTLGRRLGVTGERARQICMTASAPQKHVEQLAAYEGVTPAELCLRYSGSDKLEEIA